MYVPTLGEPGVGGFYRKGVPGAGLGTLWAGLASTLNWPRAGWLLSAPMGTLVDLCHIG